MIYQESKIYYQYLNIILMSNVNLVSKTLSPKDLFQFLLTSNYRQSQCQSQSQKVQMHKKQFTNQILQYEQQIIENKEVIQQIQSMIEVRAKLRVHLELLQEERRRNDLSFINQINYAKFKPIQLSGNVQMEVELNRLREDNCKLRVRFDELMDYCGQLEERICYFEEKNSIRPINFVGKFQKQNLKSFNFTQSSENMTWRQKVAAVKLQNQMYSAQIRQKSRFITNTIKPEIFKSTKSKQIVREAEMRYRMLAEKQNRLRFMH